MWYFIAAVAVWTLLGLVAAGYVFKLSQNEDKSRAYEDYYVSAIIAAGFFFTGPIAFSFIFLSGRNEGLWGFHSRAAAKKIQEEARMRRMQSGHGIIS